MREWEKATWAAGQTEAEVIRRVGKAIAARALQLTRPRERILILAGKGNNGEDVRNARAHLKERRVELLEVKEPARALAKLDASLSRQPGLIIDGLFGIGINRPLSADWIRLIERINEAQARVLAVDVPSGLNGDTGEPLGAAIEASMTLTVGAPKVGLLEQKAWRFVGRLEVTPDVGLAACTASSDLQWVVAEDFRGYPPPRSTATHKGNYGHVAILAGSVGYHGAAVLAARGAQRAQPGLISLYTLEPVYQVIAAQLQAVMVSPSPLPTPLPESCSAILIGPGLAAAHARQELGAVASQLWRDAPLPMVVDASALDWLAPNPAPHKAVRVITPHPGEAARLLECEPKVVQAERGKALRQLSKRFGNAWVVLKGHQTLIGRSDGEIYVNSSGNPHLAQGGSGDVLSGYVAGLLAQPELQKDVGLALRYAVWQHGAAADRLQASSANWVIEELVEELGRVCAFRSGAGP